MAKKNKKEIKEELIAELEESTLAKIELKFMNDQFGRKIVADGVKKVKTANLIGIDKTGISYKLTITAPEAIHPCNITDAQLESLGTFTMRLGKPVMKQKALDEYVTDEEGDLSEEDLEEELYQANKD